MVDWLLFLATKLKNVKNDILIRRQLYFYFKQDRFTTCSRPIEQTVGAKMCSKNAQKTNSAQDLKGAAPSAPQNL